MHRWENRSVSCEVDLEAGRRYEVLPKITATRRHRNDGSRGRPPPDVVREYAEKNPQKLRQVGMAYDLAHAKGGVPDEDERLERRAAERRRKKEDRRRRQKKQARQRKAIAKAAKAEGGGGGAAAAAVAGGTSAATKDAADQEKAVAAPAAGPRPEAPGAPKPVEAGAGGAKDAPPPPPPVEEEKKADADEASKDEGSKKAEGQSDHTETKDVSREDGKEGGAAEAEEQEGAAAAGDEEEEEEEEEEGQDDASDSDSGQDSDDNDDDDEGAIASPWNAVAVVGLRVYAQDPRVTVELVQAHGGDELTTLTVDGKPAGATM